MFTRSGKIRKTGGNIQPYTVYVHLYTLENSQQNDCNKGDFRHLLTFK